MRNIMNKKALIIYTVLSFVGVLWPKSVFGQDSLKTTEGRKFTTIGFQISDVSGIGLSIGFNQENTYRLRFTGGFISKNNITYHSLGVEYGFDLTKNKPYRVFMGPGFAVRGESDGDTHTNIGLGTGFESSWGGTTIFENMSAGVEIYYPTYYFLSNTVWFDGGAFISYNF
jgi:hypothetical protein